VTPVAPVAAATIVLTRGSGPQTEVLLVRRHSRSGFMADMFVYPGGKVDATDALHAGQFGASRVPGEALAAAVRETFEEAGLLLAATAAGAPADAAAVDAVAASVAAGEAFAAALARAGLRADTASIGAFARWVTPVVESRRFDTWFLIAEAPAGQQARADGREITEHRWGRPADLIEAYQGGAFDLSPPTFYTLCDLAALFGSEQAVWTWAQAQSLEPILPLLEFAEVPRLLLPGDREYPAPVPVAGPSRMVIEQGRWRRLDVRGAGAETAPG
jgi:8-oxo-dGTP pyrophosphatase MutT (NUDIX family)